MAARTRKRKNPAKMGRPPIFGATQLYSLRLPKTLHEQLQAYARKDGRSMNFILLDVIEKWWASLPDGREYRRSGPHSE